jgi:hypothetical protein
MTVSLDLMVTWNNELGVIHANGFRVVADDAREAVQTIAKNYRPEVSFSSIGY